MIDGRPLTVKTSIGIAMSESGRESPGELLRRADLAMYVAKDNGRGGTGCVIFWAAGNGNESVDKDGYASNPDVMAVAACNSPPGLNRKSRITPRMP